MSKDRLYSVVGYRSDRSTKIIAEHVAFDIALKLIQEEQQNYVNVSIIEEYYIPWLPKNLFVVANTESLYEETKELLYRPAHLNETFVFLGNYVGALQFLPFMRYLVDFRKKRPCIFVKGKNEYNVLEYIQGTYQYIGDEIAIHDLIRSIENQLTYNLKLLPNKEPAIYQLLLNAVDYYESDNYIFVPGGLDLSLSYWKQTSLPHLLITTDEFIRLRNTTGKKIVFGDRSTTELNGGPIYGIWENNRGDKIGINGDCKNQGKLLGYSILDGETNYFTVRSKEGRRIRQLKRDATDEFKTDNENELNNK